VRIAAAKKPAPQRQGREQEWRDGVSVCRGSGVWAAKRKGESAKRRKGE